jgi:hypothetical protein
LDGVAPRPGERHLLPNVSGMERMGAARWSTRTVSPSITLAVQVSLRRGVDPSERRVAWNSPTTPLCHANRLRKASMETSAQQGGQLSGCHVKRFLSELRGNGAGQPGPWGDDRKVVGLATLVLDHHPPFISQILCPT